MADCSDVNWRSRLSRWGVWSTALLWGCVTAGPSRTPSRTLSDYASALAAGDARKAHALLTPSERARLSREDLERALREHPAEARELAGMLSQRHPPRVTAVVLLEDGSELRLERDERGAFRVVDPLTRFYGQSTPREALVSFVRAVQRRRWDVVLSLMPEEERRGLDAEGLGAALEARLEELTRLAALLSTARDNPIEVVGDHATMPYAESYTARLVREGDGWKIVDPE